MLGVGTTTLVSHAAGQKDRDRARARLQPVAGAVGARRRAVLRRSRWRVRMPYVDALGADPTTARPGRRLPALVHPGDGAAVRAWCAMGAALRGTGNFKPGMVVQTATVIINIVLAPVSDLRLGHGPAAGRRRRGDLDARRDRRRRRLAVHVLLGRRRVPEVRAARTGSRDFALWRDMLEIGLPAGRRVRADGGLPGHRLRRQPPVRRGGAGGLRHRHARRPGAVHAGGGARVRGRAGRRTELRRPARRARARDVPGRRC